MDPDAPDLTDSDPGDVAAGLAPEAFPVDASPDAVPVALTIQPQLLLPVPTSSSADALPSGPSIGTTTTTTDMGDLDGVLGGLVGSLLSTGVSALNGIVVNPAIAAAGIPAQQEAQQLALGTSATQSAISTSSISTILLWAALAFGLVILFSDVGKKV